MYKNPCCLVSPVYWFVTMATIFLYPQGIIEYLNMYILIFPIIEEKNGVSFDYFQLFIFIIIPYFLGFLTFRFKCLFFPSFSAPFSLSLIHISHLNFFFFFCSAIVSEIQFSFQSFARSNIIAQRSEKKKTNKNPRGTNQRQFTVMIKSSHVYSI